MLETSRFLDKKECLGNNRTCPTIVLKTVEGASPPGVRIPPLPPLSTAFKSATFIRQPSLSRGSQPAPPMPRRKILIYPWHFFRPPVKASSFGNFPEEPINKEGGQIRQKYHFYQQPLQKINQASLASYKVRRSCRNHLSIKFQQRLIQAMLGSYS